MPPVSPDRTPRVALLFPLRPGPWPEIVRGVYRYAARQSPRWILSLHTEEDPALALAGEPDGIVAMVRTPEIAAKLATWGGPVVDTAADLKSHAFARVLLDSEQIGQVAAEYLLREKGRQFAFVGNENTLAGESVRIGYETRLRESGCTCVVAPAGVFDDPYHEGPRARAAAAAWLSHLPRPVAVFACHDALAHRLVEVCAGVGLRVPQDVAVLGLLNDEFLCLTSQPQISSIAVPLAGVGYEAAQLLDSVMAGETSRRMTIQLPPGEIVVRESTDVSVVSDPSLSAALHYIRDHAGEPIGVDDIAEAIGVSRSSLERRFRSLLGRGPLAELIRVRVEHAKRLLTESALSVKQIARSVGFHDTRHLSVTFRSKTGMSPIEYRACFRVV